MRKMVRKENKAKVLIHAQDPAANLSSRTHPSMTAVV